MAQQTRLVLVNDLTGKAIDEGRGETVAFGIDGSTYQIDLDHGAARRLRAAFAPYIRKGRRTGGRKTIARPLTITHTYDNKTVRRWAAAKGLDVPPRGRIPDSVIEQFTAAGN